MRNEDLLTYEEIKKRFGLEILDELDQENCEFTNRLMTNGEVEFTASLEILDNFGDEITLTAYYYQDQDDVDAVENLDELDWEIYGYEVIE